MDTRSASIDSVPRRRSSRPLDTRSAPGRSGPNAVKGSTAPGYPLHAPMVEAAERVSRFTMTGLHLDRADRLACAPERPDEICDSPGVRKGVSVPTGARYPCRRKAAASLSEVEGKSAPCGTRPAIGFRRTGPRGKCRGGLGSSHEGRGRLIARPRPPSFESLSMSSPGNSGSPASVPQLPPPRVSPGVDHFENTRHLTEEFASESPLSGRTRPRA